MDEGKANAAEVAQAAAADSGRRIARGLAANLASIGTRILVQFATLPIFFANWSPERVGTWLIVFAIPVYIALVGNGFCGAGGTSSLAAAQAGDMRAARTNFRAAWTISAMSTAVLALLFAGTAMFLTPSLIEPRAEVGIWDIAKAAAWLSLYIFASNQMAVFDIPFRVAGRYPDHIFLFNATSLLEIVVIAAAVTFSQSLAVLAMSLALFRCLAAAYILYAARRAEPRLFKGEHDPVSSRLGELWKPSLAFMMLPLIYGLNLQGYVLVVSAAFGAVVLAGFVATRVLTRMLDLGTNIAFAMLFYESGYLEADRKAIQRRMLATVTAGSLVLAAGFTVVLMLLGAWAQDLYTLGESRFAPAVALVLVCASTFRALSAAPIAILAAENAHPPVMTRYLAGSAAALALATLFGAADLPLPVILLPIILAEASQMVPAMSRALAHLEIAPADFMRTLVSRERISDVKALIHTLGKKA